MQHGRDHDSRLFHASHQRSQNIPPDEPATNLEAEFLTSGRHQALAREDVATTQESGAEGPEPSGGRVEGAGGRERGVDVAKTEEPRRRE